MNINIESSILNYFRRGDGNPKARGLINIHIILYKICNSTQSEEIHRTLQDVMSDPSAYRG